MSELKDLMNVTADPWFRCQVVGTLFQCSNIVGDGELCRFYAQMYLDEGLSCSAFDCEILLSLLKHKLKNNSSLEECEVIVARLEVIEELEPEQRERSLFLIAKYLIVEYIYEIRL
jgi:hypothetical protein